MTAGRFDVIIVGAGAAGLWTARRLAEAGARVLVLYAPHWDGYSSTRNQGWLHSGALYAVFHAPGVTRECIAGSRIVLDFAERHDRSLIADAEFCYVLGSSQQAEAAVAACREAGIDARQQGSHRQLRALFGRPVSPVTVPDRAVDASRLLRTLARQATAGGACAAAVPALFCVRLRRAGDAWHVTADGLKVSAPSVVIAAGTLTPSLLASAAAANGFHAAMAFEATQTTVLGIPGLILPAVVCIGGGPHLIPHRTAEACGATLCIPFDNQPTRPESVHCSPDAAARDRVLANIREFTPGLAAVIEARRTFWYSCQKLIPVGAVGRPDWRHSVLAEAAPGLWAAYAGKFTTAPVLADHAARLLGGALSGASGAPGQGTVDIADQPFRADRADLVRWPAEGGQSLPGCCRLRSRRPVDLELALDGEHPVRPVLVLDVPVHGPG
jgi:glycine/D-amino acid oxidase-like deaminating enzyme